MLEVTKLEILNDNILVQGIREELVNGIRRGISTDDKPQLGLVLKVGPGKMLETGLRQDSVVQVAMVVLFNEHTTTKFNIGGVTYYVLKEEDVIGYQKDYGKNPAQKVGKRK